MGDINSIKIVGCCSIKNEELYIEQVIRNILDFCDEIIVVDNMSEDQTFDIVTKLAKAYSKIRLFREENLLLIQDYVAQYAGTNTWVFWVDGDELYDPRGLRKLRTELLNRKYQDKWQVRGNFLHCTEIDLTAWVAKGYLAPPRTSRQSYIIIHY